MSFVLSCMILEHSRVLFQFCKEFLSQTGHKCDNIMHVLEDNETDTCNRMKLLYHFSSLARGDSANKVLCHLTS